MIGDGRSRIARQLLLIDCLKYADQQADAEEESLEVLLAMQIAIERYLRPHVGRAPRSRDPAIL